jgi:hypothetical protein
MPRFLRLQASFLLLLVWESSCHNRKVAIPVPPPPATNQPAPPTPAPAAATSATPTSGTTTQPQEPASYQVNKPPQPSAAAKKPTRSAPAPAPSPAPSASPSPAPASPAPKLGDILTPDEQKQYNASVDESLSHAQNSLNSLRGRQLSKDQQAQVEQIQNFMQQAQKTRASDLAGAKSLAERAEVLAKDLAANVR